MDIVKIYFAGQIPGSTNRCKRCDLDKPLTAEFWSVRKVQRAGKTLIELYPYCKACRKEINREQYEDRKAREAGVPMPPTKGTCDCCGWPSQKREWYGDKAICLTCKYVLDQGDLEEGLAIFKTHMLEEEFLDAKAGSEGHGRNPHSGTTTINTDEFKSHNRCLRIYNSLKYAIEFDKLTKV